ncbi:MAG: hypothetical protein JWR72_853 [Flavisolibacter sp.]|nr:hypothetical protein [Flavisolibacter sp.]
MNFKNPVTNSHAHWVAVLFLFLTTLFIRLPFFFRDYTDPDESTFILMGQSIADGHLPYDHLWDLKPPLLFYIFGAIEYVVPHSFIAIRFFGVLVVFTSALFLMKIAQKTRIENGFLVALLYIILSSELGNLQGLMSEHLAVFFILPGLLCLLEKRNLLYSLLAGICFGCALLCKLSYAYAIVALLVCFLLLNWRKNSFEQIFKSNLILLFGLLLPFFLISIPFLVEKKPDVFIDSVFLAPLEYGHAQQYSFLQKIERTWWIILIGLLVSYLSIKKITKENKPLAIASIAILLGTIYTFFSSGIVNGHYLIQVFPFILLLAVGIIIQRKFKLRWRFLVLFVILISVESLVEYYRLAKSYSQNSTFYYRPGFQVVNELKSRGLDNKKIFFADYHIGYWLLHQYPLTKSTTHPSNINRSYLFKYFDVQRNSIEELKYILEGIRPDVVVSKREQLSFFSPDSGENAYFKTTMNKEFTILQQDEKNRIVIWQRNKK